MNNVSFSNNPNSSALVFRPSSGSDSSPSPTWMNHLSLKEILEMQSTSDSEKASMTARVREIFRADTDAMLKTSEGRFTCLSSCATKPIRKPDFLDHILSVHIRSVLHECNACKRVFCTDKSFKRHQNEVHKATTGEVQEPSRKRARIESGRPSPILMDQHESSSMIPQDQRSLKAILEVKNPGDDEKATMIKRVEAIFQNKTDEMLLKGWELKCLSPCSFKALSYHYNDLLEHILGEHIQYRHVKCSDCDRLFHTAKKMKRHWSDCHRDKEAKKPHASSTVSIQSAAKPTAQELKSEEAISSESLSQETSPMASRSATPDSLELGAVFARCVYCQADYLSEETMKSHLWVEHGFNAPNKTVQATFALVLAASVTKALLDD